MGRILWTVAASLALLLVLPCSGSVTELPKVLQSGVPLYELAASRDETLVFRIDIPADAKHLTVVTEGGRGDCDLYVRHGAHPTTDDYTAASETYGNSDQVSISDPDQGPWYILLNPSRVFTGLRLSATYELKRTAVAVPIFSLGTGIYPGAVKVQLKSPNTRAIIRYTVNGAEPTIRSPRVTKLLSFTRTTTVKARAFLPDGSVSPVSEATYTIETVGNVNTLASGVPAFHRGGASGSMSVFKIAVPAGQKSLRIATSGGRGDSEIFLTKDKPPTAHNYQYRSNGPHNAATILVNTPEEGEWYVALRGRGPFYGVALQAAIATSSPDLVVWSSSLQPYISTEEFSPGDCEVAEGMVVPGVRRLLRFTTESRNIGGEDLVLGSHSDHPEWYEYAECHGHYHFLGFASYRLLDSNGVIAATGRKVSFCLEDVVPWALGVSESKRYNCEYQGIQAGWADVYDSGLPGQFIDITGVPPGTYTLEITVNPEQILSESDYTNNSTSLEVVIPEAEVK